MADMEALEYVLEHRYYPALEVVARDLRDLADKVERASHNARPDSEPRAFVETAARVVQDVHNALANLHLGLLLQAASDAQTAATERPAPTVEEAVDRTAAGLFTRERAEEIAARYRAERPDASPVDVVPPDRDGVPTSWSGRSAKMRARDYRGLIERRGESGRREATRCPHKHRTEDAAVRCGRRLAAAANAGTVILPLSSCATTVRRVLGEAGLGLPGLEVRADGARAVVSTGRPEDLERMREHLDGAGWQAVVRGSVLSVGRRS